MLADGSRRFVLHFPPARCVFGPAGSLLRSACHGLLSGKGAARWRSVFCLGSLVVANGLFAVSQATEPVSPQQDLLLEEVQKRAMLYFAEHSDLATGLTRDRAPNQEMGSDAPASIAATGFSLTAWCIADSRGWLPPGYAAERVRVTLRFVANHVEHERGWIYHFVDVRTGRRVWRSEASTIDTALFLQGAIQAREYLNDPEITDLVNQIYGRIDWRWALNHGATLSHGWLPEEGFIPYRWDAYAEHMGLYLLGIGAPEHALPAETWEAWRRPRVRYADRTFIQGGPLFTHQYAQAWFDFRGVRDGHADYWQNSVDATLAQRAWFSTLSNRFRHLSEDVWGLTSSDSMRGYRAWGSPGRTNESSDGTLVPCAPAGSLPFAPQECLGALERMILLGGDRVWGRYGFADAFNPVNGWVSPDVIGIDVGIMMVQAENLRTGFVWNTFMRAPEVQRGMKLAGFRPTQEQPHPVEVKLATQ